MGPAGDSLRIHNTLTRRKDRFASPDGRVRMYVCGVTPYDTTHLGHARTYVVFDVLVRHLIHKGFRVDYVQNITDVDDSILARARQLGESYRALGERYTAVFLEDIARLGLIPPAEIPLASSAIEEMQEVIRRLLATGHAYRVDTGDVYLRVDSIPSYGRLSGLPRARMLEIESEQDGSTVDDPRKHDPLDILLWKAKRPGEPSWDAPWGEGRPGWHIECSTLALRHLGKQIDIHGGGADLTFPHHEAEIAQAEAVTGVRPFARFWVHVEMALFEGRKMSKSDGNLVYVRDLLEDFSPDAVRLYLLSTHYRRPLDYSRASLEEAAGLARRLAEAANLSGLVPGGRNTSMPDFEARFLAALDDDLDTPQAVGLLPSLADGVHADANGAYRAQRALRKWCAYIGLGLESAAA